MKRGQSATLDMLIAILIVSAGTIFIVNFGLPVAQQSPAYDDVRSASEALFNPFPQNWTNETVIVPGFIVDHKINESLFLQAQDLDNFQGLLSSQSNIFVNTTLGTIGEYPDSLAADIVSVTRFAAYNGNITSIEVIAWTPR